MEIPYKEMTPGQASLLARAKAVTDAQFEAARDILSQQFMLDRDHPPRELLLATVQILSTNYLASVTKSNG